MKLRSDCMTRLTRFFRLASVAVVSGALCVSLATAQQDQSGAATDRPPGTILARINRTKAATAAVNLTSGGVPTALNTPTAAARTAASGNPPTAPRATTNIAISSRAILAVNQLVTKAAAASKENTAWLGVFLSENDRNQGNQQGAMVTQVYPAGPAARAACVLAT